MWFVYVPSVNQGAWGVMIVFLSIWAKQVDALHAMAVDLMKNVSFLVIMRIRLSRQS